MRTPSMSMMIHVYKSLTPCRICHVQTKSNAVPSSYVGFYRSPLPIIVHSCVFPAIQRDERVLVVWSDNPTAIIPQCKEFEDHLIKLVWTRRHSLSTLSPGASIPATPAGASAATSVANSSSDVQLNEKPKELENIPEPEPEPSAKPVSGGSLWGWRIASRAKRSPAPRDLEHGGASARPTRYFAPVYGGLGLALSFCAISSSVEPFLDANSQLQVFIASGANILLQEYRLTGTFIRFALMATAPLLFCVSLVSSYSTSFSRA